MKLLSRLIFLALLLPSAAWAHKFAPSLLSVVESVPNSYTVTFKTPVQTITRSPMKPTWPEGCWPVILEHPIRVGTGIITKWGLSCNPPADNLAGKSFGVSGLAANRANAIFTLRLIDGTDFQAMLNADHPTYLILAPRGAGGVSLDYLALGVKHIWGGLDHLLFVFGLLMLISGGVGCCGQSLRSRWATASHSRSPRWASSSRFDRGANSGKCIYFGCHPHK